MATVFISGSINIKKLHSLVLERLSNIVAANHSIVIGDASGSDLSVQKALLDLGAKEVTVYCSGKVPRNNIGNWPIHCIFPRAKEGTREYFTAKDIEMAKAADFGLMIWDAKSTGTLSNIMELLKKGKISLVFLNKKNTFMKVSEVSNFNDLTNNMSIDAKELAEKKIHFSTKVASLSDTQMSMPI